MKRLRKHDFDLIVIGSGAGGAVGASYARSLGKSVAIVEKNKVLGGECPNWACIPTKALLQAAEVYLTAKEAKSYGVTTGKVSINQKQMRKWKELVVSRTGAAEGGKLFEDEGIALMQGEAKFISPREIEVNGAVLRAKKFLLGTGSETIIPPIPGLDKSGYITFFEATEFKKIPKSILILGGGPIGCEFAQLYSDLGSEVYLAEMAPRLLTKDEPEVGELTEALFVDRGVGVLTNCKVTKVSKKGTKKTVLFEVGGHKDSVVVDEVLVATGKKAHLGFSPDAGGIKVADGRIVANDYLQTSNKNVFVAGDVIGPLQFTHTAAYQSRIAVHNAFSRKKVKPNYISIPRVTFTRPEVASVGMSADQAKQRGIKTKIGVTPTSVIGRANTSDQFDGFVKVITDKRGVLIGASIVAPRAGEMIHELALAIKLRATAYEITELVHAFPTYSEAVKIACANLE